MSSSFELSLAAVDILAESLGVNPRQFPFKVPSVGQLHEDRVRIAKAVFTDLERRGLITRRGDLDPDLERALRTLFDSVISVAAMGTVEQNRKIYARAGAAGETGVIAEQRDQRVTLRLVRSSALAMNMIDLLPPLKSGPGQSVTVARQEKQQASRDDGVTSMFQPVRPTSGGNDRQRRLAQAMLDRPRTGAGFFAVHGQRNARAGELGWIDTDAGRYLLLTKPVGEDGQARGTYSPADKARMVQHLGDLIMAVAPRAN